MKDPLRFLLSGHSFLPNDSEFGDVERSLKIQQRLHTDVDYINVMKECRRKNKFVVNKMERQEMVSIHKLLENTTNRKIDSNKDKVSWVKTHEIKILKSEPFKLYVKTNTTEGNLQIIDIEKKKKGRQHKSFKDIQLDSLWPTGKEKIKDLKEILKLVPQELKSFYNFLRTAQQGEFSDDVDGFGVSNVDFDIDEDED